MGFIMKTLLDRIFNYLDMNSETGLATEKNFTNLTPFQKLFYSQVHEKIGIDAVYFLRDENGVPKIPIIYFTAIDRYDPKYIAELHRLAWNVGEAPLLFVVTPDEILIYNNYVIPSIEDNVLKTDAGIIETLKTAEVIASNFAKLREYHRSLLESGEYWRKSKNRFDIQGRVDSTLISNLRIMRKALIAQISSRSNLVNKDIINIVHSLLSRSIFIKYLEERTDSNGETVFPKDFFSSFLLKANCYTDILVDKEATYNLFLALREKFNGDILQVTKKEKEVVTQEDLTELRMFLLANSKFSDKQLTLWKLYSFDVIPIQLISNIYELFFHLTDEKDVKGTYYTPLHLVNLIMDEIYPWEGKYSPISFFDPSCGSGIFLVEAYRRIVCRWIANHEDEPITCAKLIEILTKCIFGVDINEDAVRVSSFSLNLALCDFLDPKSIWEKLSIPRLIGKNLMVSDFFDPDKNFNKLKYNIIVGNPPWESNITKLTELYLLNGKKVIGDKQIAQAFSLKCADLIKKNGMICLILPSKGFLFNRSANNIKYRHNFFRDNNVLTIVNLSVYRKFLFDHASGPATIVIYTPNNKKKTTETPIIYCTPKPLYTIEDIRKFSIDPNDICRIPRDIVFNDYVWKVAMWGTPRDLELISKMKNTFYSMKHFIEQNDMNTAEGFTRGSRKRQCDDLLGLPLIDTKKFQANYIPKKCLNKIDFTDFESTVKKSRVIFKAPHLIVKQSHKKGFFLSALLDYDAAFNHSLLGIHGETSKLKYLSLIIGSKVFSYYHILTNRKWLIERDELEAGDIWATPVPMPTDRDLREANCIFDKRNHYYSNNNLAEDFVRRMYHLQSYEQHQIDDVFDYVLDYFQKKSKSISFVKPDEAFYNFYYKALTEALYNTFGKRIKLTGALYYGTAPLSVLVLHFSQDELGRLQTHKQEDKLEEVLTKLDADLLEEKYLVYIRRNLRIYQRDKIYIVKPAQQKYWTYSAACRDADEIFSDIAKSWR